MVRRIERARLLGVLGALSVAATSCDDGVQLVCTQELGVRIAPQGTIIQVGQSYPISVRMTTCGGRVTLEDHSLTFTSLAPAVASVDPTLGVVTGETAGDAQVDISLATSGIPVRRVGVTVTP